MFDTHTRVRGLEHASMVRLIDYNFGVLLHTQGGIEDGEEPRYAAIRELREETGVVSAEIIAEVHCRNKILLSLQFFPVGLLAVACHSYHSIMCCSFFIRCFVLCDLSKCIIYDAYCCLNY